ncbi:MAG: cyclomaltodextrinase N-terminal domain-containing protein [Ignavibacteriales bacterium]|nr:cyclomaltodextrinase N-terminal domain-containing protein [Ignavibacteriales bacterium]
MKKFFIAILFIVTISFAQNLSVEKVEPSNWWIGMKLNKIQLMIYGSNLKNFSASFDDRKIKVLKTHQLENPNYAFIDIEIPNNLPAKVYKLKLNSSNQTVTIDFPIYKREKTKNKFQGFNQTDAIYLIMPDRFVNGDVSNDSIAGYSDSMQKIQYQGRAGGDLQGVINKLDYIKELGFTAIWLTPIVENNTFRSYHGYAATDFYKVDPRLGTNELYKKLVEEAHKRNLKIIFDHVANHCSDDHPWMKNLPMKNWFNGTKENHLEANHNKMVFTDIHADSTTIKQVEQGWFVNSMPDLNQENIYVQNYIIQNTIWWMEYAGFDGIREDTYPYNNQIFMSRWAKTILNEYPTTNIVGEVWTGEVDFLSTYQKNNPFKKMNTYLPSVTDFALRDVLIRFVEGKDNTYQIFNVLAKDYLYTDATQLLTFVDNHDLPRLMYFAKGNIQKAKMAYDILFTVRGIPQIFYGSEIGMVGTDDHGSLRIPFPGGFPNDKRNAFTEQGRADYENDIFNHLKTLLKIRNSNKAFTLGKLVHFPPINDVYVYFRIHGNEKFMIVVNNNSKTQLVNFSSMNNYVSPKNNLIDMRSNKKYQLNDEHKLEIPEMSSMIFKVE